MDHVFSELSVNEVISYIHQSSDTEILSIMEAVSNRFKISCPDWDVIYLSLPKYNAEERREILNRALSLMDKLYENG